MHNAKLAGEGVYRRNTLRSNPIPLAPALRVRVGTGFGNAVLAVLVLRMLVDGVEGSR